MPFLVPGVGAQGGDLEAVVRAGLDRRGRGLILNASRSIIGAPNPGAEARALRDAIRTAATRTVVAGAS
jgi:orotidine-5'-phosphate decarboxylase